MSDLIHNRYALIDALGIGGMGAVFRASDRHLNREVALKVARVDPPDQERLAQATLFLKREARALATLNHPSIPIIFDYSSDAHEPAYLAMELIEGTQLGTLVTPKAPLPVLVTLALIQKVASALAHAHQAGLLHGDIKPENIMVQPSGRVVLMDFGCTQAMRSKVLGNTASVAGDFGVFGSLEFLSPEHIAGDALGNESDIFSLGTLAYLLSLGRLPFDEARPTETMKRIAAVDFVPAATAAPELPPGLTGLIGACLQRNPRRRPKARHIAETLLEGFRTHWRTNPDFELELWARGLGLSNSQASPNEPKERSA